MSKVWEFFENMNEAVYASDVDTYELLYLNKAARDLFQFKDESDYKGKNCYEILQQCSSPCAMCTNNRLKPDEFYEWSRFNPLVRRSYLLKDTMVIDDGRRVRIEMAIDLDIHELAKRSFSEFTDNEALINEGLRCALAEETPEQSIDTLLQYLGQMFQSDRVYIFEKNKTSELLSTRKIGGDRSGTGDVFSSIVTGALIQGQDFKTAVKRAVTFLDKAIAYTAQMELPWNYGICFEEYLEEI